MLGRGATPHAMCSARPAAVPPPWDPARGCIEGIELFKQLTIISKLAPRCRAPCRIMHAAAAVGAGSVSEMTT